MKELRVKEPRSLRRNERGYPLAWTTLVDEHGVENPCQNDDDRVRFCYRHRLCGICGEPLPPGDPMCFIGGAEQVRRRLFYDPAMHPDCAVFATGVCPFLANPQWKSMGRSHTSGRNREKQFILFTTGYKVQRIRRLFRKGQWRDRAAHALDTVKVEDVDV